MPFHKSLLIPRSFRAIAFVYFLNITAWAQPTEEAIFRELSQKFYQTYEKKDVSESLRWWHAQSPDFAAYKQQIEKLFPACEKIELLSLAVRRVEWEGQTVKVRVALGLNAIDAKTAKPLVEWAKTQRVLYWRKENDGWKLWQELSAFQELADRLLAIPKDDERRRLLASEQELATTDLAGIINNKALSNGQSANPDFPFIIQALQLGHDIALKADDKVRVSNTLHNLSVFCFRQGNYHESISYGEKAVQMRTALGNQDGVAQSLTQIATTYSDMGKYAEAKKYYDQALDLREKLGPLPMLAQVLNQYGNWFLNYGDFDKALSAYQRALNIRETLRREKPQDSENLIAISRLQGNIGLIHAEQGDHVNALRLFEQRLTITRSLKRDEGEVLQYIGSIYRRQGDYDQALKYYGEALQAHKPQGNPVSIIDTLNHLGDIARERGQYAQALDYFGQAREIGESKNNQNLLPKVYSNIGRVYAGQRNYVQALAYFQKGLASCEMLNTRDGCAEYNYLIASAYYNQGDYQRALPLAERAAAGASLIGKPELQQRAYVNAGRIYRALNQLEKAREAFVAAIAATERLRQSVAGDEQQRQAFFENKTEAYLELTELLLAQNDRSEAFRYAESAKARTLRDVLQSGKFNLAKTLTPMEQAREREFINHLTLLNSQLYKEKLRREPDQARLTELSAAVERARLDYEDFRTRLYASHPDLKMQRGESRTLTMAEAAELLPDEKTVLLSYVVAPERGHLFVLTKAKTGEAKLRVYPLAVKREELAAQVEQFRNQLAERSSRYAAPSRELYDRLLKPAKAGLPPQARLVIVPDGPLWELPFQALLTERNRYLWEEHVISYAPSLTVLREMSRPRRELIKTPSLFAIGDPALGGESVERVKALMGGGLEQLPEARTQVEALRKFYDPNRSKVSVGAEAAEAMVKAEAGKFDILHFATHGVLNDRSPLYSHILLAQTDAAKPESNLKEVKEDGLLEAWEIMRMDLRADLAVLSACETARGRVGAGEGMIGLTWAMFVAGVPTTVVSQWKVRSDSTAALMVEFHRLLQARDAKRAPGHWTKAEALRQAALKLLRSGQYRHPFHWAGFVLVGKPQ